MKSDQIVIVAGEVDVKYRRHGTRKVVHMVVGVAIVAATVVSFLWLIMLSSASGIEGVRMKKEAEKSIDSMFHLIAIKHGRRLLSAVPDSKKEALNFLEGAILEPPTTRHQRPHPKYLPDLMRDSLAGYPRRVFVDVGPPGRTNTEKWFKHHYPRRDGADFDIVRVDEVGSSGGGSTGMSEWLNENVKEEEYVVMKAEAEVVLELVRSKSVGLVDEMFLECRNQWNEEEEEEEEKKSEKSRRAYWECVAIYGRLKDEGIAVHQWWD